MLRKQEHPKSFREVYRGGTPKRALIGDEPFSVQVGSVLIR